MIELLRNIGALAVVLFLFGRVFGIIPASEIEAKPHPQHAGLNIEELLRTTTIPEEPVVVPEEPVVVPEEPVVVESKEEPEVQRAEPEEIFTPQRLTPVERVALPPPPQDEVDRKFLWTLYALTEKNDRTGFFAWKDEKAVARSGKSPEEYHIGGLKKKFMQNLAAMLRAMQEDGLPPGLMSCFRDDYRQSLISSLDKKSAVSMSFHGGSARGGWGSGEACDLIYREPNWRERVKRNMLIWTWIDTHGKKFGLGRPYPTFDPMHVTPLEGREYVAARGVSKKSTVARKAPTKQKRTKLARA